MPNRQSTKKESHYASVVGAPSAGFSSLAWCNVEDCGFAAIPRRDLSTPAIVEVGVGYSVCLGSASGGCNEVEAVCNPSTRPDVLGSAFVAPAAVESSAFCGSDEGGAEVTPFVCGLLLVLSVMTKLFGSASSSSSSSSSSLSSSASGIASSASSFAWLSHSSPEGASSLRSSSEPSSSSSSLMRFLFFRRLPPLTTPLVARAALAPPRTGCSLSLASLSSL